MALVARLLPPVAALLALGLAGNSQRAGAQVAYNAPGERVEVLGLHTWTLAALQDSIRHRVAGQTLEDAACMVTLRDSLHFADALVNKLTFADRIGGPERHYLIVKVIEPQEAMRVRWAPTPPDSFTVLRPVYAEVVLPATDSVGRFGVGRILWPLQFYARSSAARAAALTGTASRREDARRLWHFLDAHHSEADRRTALTALHRDGSYANRLIAAAVLANFPDRDSTWMALVEALRDPNEAVRETALIVLREMPARQVDWTTATPTLRLLLGGTNLSAMESLFTVLARTQVNPTLARPLLHDNGTWVLMHLRAEYPGAQASAHALLAQLSGGRDLGTSDTAWAHWLASL